MPLNITRNTIVTGPLFSEPMRVESIQPGSTGSMVLGLVGTQTERFRSVTLTPEDIEKLTLIDAIATYRGDGKLLRPGLQAYALGIAYEFDPCFGLSISRVDPLPHQLEAVYDYLLKAWRTAFFWPGLVSLSRGEQGGALLAGVGCVDRSAASEGRMIRSERSSSQEALLCQSQAKRPLETEDERWETDGLRRSPVLGLRSLRAIQRARERRHSTNGC